MSKFWWWMVPIWILAGIIGWKMGDLTIFAIKYHAVKAIQEYERSQR